MDLIVSLDLYKDFTVDTIDAKIGEFRRTLKKLLKTNTRPSFVFKTRLVNKYPYRVYNTNQTYISFTDKPSLKDLTNEFSYHLKNFFQPNSHQIASAVYELYAKKNYTMDFETPDEFFRFYGESSINKFILKTRLYVKQNNLKGLLEKEVIETKIINTPTGQKTENVEDYIFKSPTRGINKFLKKEFPDDPDKDYETFILEAYDLNTNYPMFDVIYEKIRIYLKTDDSKVLRKAMRESTIPYVQHASEGNCFINCLIDKFPKHKQELISIAKDHVSCKGVDEELIRNIMEEYSPDDHFIVFHTRFNEPWKQMKTHKHSSKIDLYVSNNHVSRTPFAPIPFDYKPNQITYIKDIHDSFLKRSQIDHNYEVFFDNDAKAICWRDNEQIVLIDDPKINRKDHPLAMSRASAIVSEIKLEFPMYVSGKLDRFYKNPLRYMPSGLIVKKEYKDLMLDYECGNIHRHDIRAAFSTPWQAKKYFVLSGVPYGTIHTCDNSIFDLNFGGLVFLTIKNPDPTLNITDGWYSYSEAWYHVDNNNATATHIIPAPREDKSKFRYIFDSFRDEDSKFSLNAAIGKFQSKNKSNSAIITTKEELDLLILSSKYTIKTIRPYQDFNDDTSFVLPYFIQYQDPEDIEIGRFPHFYQEIIGATRIRLFEQKKYLESQKATIIGYRIDCIIYEHPEQIPCSNDFKHEISDSFPMFECMGKYDETLNEFDHQGSIDRISFLNKGKLIEFHCHGGFGKTHKIKELLELFPDNAIAIASTNAAARLLNGKTIDSFIIESTRYIPQSIIIIDEVSMCSIENHFSPLNKNLSLKCKQLFGGKTVIISGHNKQLPPINGKPIYKHRTYKLFHRANIFTKNYRTNDGEQEFAKDLERYADNNDNSLISNIGHAKHTEITANATIITFSNKQKDLFNAMQFKRFAKDHPIPIIAKPTKKILKYNNKEYFNNETFTVSYDEYERIKHDKQFALGYAVTTHCVQGQTIDNNIYIVSADLNTASSSIKRNLFYTAISRARRYSQVSFILRL